MPSTSPILSSVWQKNCGGALPTSGKIRNIRGTWPLLDFGLHIFADYQRTLRGAVDFDDLIVLALRALEADENYLLRLQNRWPYILEDEAQDSGFAARNDAAQRRQPRQLVWGDPNQAINTPFTSADTRYRKTSSPNPNNRDRPTLGARH